MKFVSICILFTLSLIFLSPIVYSQETSSVDENDLKIELEPASFALSGISGSILYAVTDDDKLSIGLFGAALDVPNRLRPIIFNNVGSNDTSRVRLGFEAALNIRYQVRIFKQYESNPYIGLIFGWEYFDIHQPAALEKIRLSTWLATPYLGYEFYFYKKMLYINPQLRGVYYFGKKSSDVNRPESIRDFLILPQVAIGIKF